jgi:hypothetical protein
LHAFYDVKLTVYERNPHLKMDDPTQQRQQRRLSQSQSPVPVPTAPVTETSTAPDAVETAVVPVPTDDLDPVMAERRKQFFEDRKKRLNAQLGLSREGLREQLDTQPTDGPTVVRVVTERINHVIGDNS